MPLLELSLPELQKRSRDANATLQAARHRMLAVEEQVKIADSSFWPQLILGGQYGYTNRSLREAAVEAQVCMRQQDQGCCRNIAAEIQPV